MLQKEYDNLVAWLKSPFNTQMPMWKLMLVFVLFVIVAIIVIDNFDMLMKGLEKGVSE